MIPGILSNRIELLEYPNFFDRTHIIFQPSEREAPVDMSNKNSRYFSFLFIFTIASIVTIAKPYK